MSPTRAHSLHAASFAAVIALASVGGCHSTDSTGVTPPPGSASLTVGATADVPNGHPIDLTGGGEFVLVVTDTAISGTGTSNYQVAVTGTAAPGSVSPPATSLIPSAELSSVPIGLGTQRLDISYGARLNERYRGRFRSMMQSGRSGMQASRSIGFTSGSAVPQVGDIVTYNVSASACDNIVNHGTRITAVGSKSIVAVDTLNPPGGFTTADYQRFAANFDTLVYPLDVTNFGVPADIDQNGRIIILFTRAVNELTPPNSGFFVGGFFFSRDLFPRVATQTLQACAGSNVAEMFYMLAPDPTGAVNSNVRTLGFVDSLTTSVLGHEFQHLINASRRIYVNNADDLEVVWLNEGLSHIAEELLFYRQATLAPRQNLTAAVIRATTAARNAFNQDQASNAGRYGVLLAAPSVNSPVRDDDSLGTRGATWNFLRYAADRKVRGGGPETDVWQALVNSTTTGVPNLRGVFGPGVPAWVRDWSVSHYTDDVVPNIAVDLTQPSWNWHDIYAALGNGGAPYPLQILPMPTTGASGTLIPGSFAVYRFAIPASGTATITVSGGATSSGLPIGTIVRIR